MLNTTLRLAKHPCRNKVKEGNRTLTCLDRWRTVKGKGKNAVVKCLTHNHASRGKAKQLV